MKTRTKLKHSLLSFSFGRFKLLPLRTFFPFAQLRKQLTEELKELKEKKKAEESRRKRLP